MRNEWDQLDEAMRATRHGLSRNARAVAAPMSKQRQGWGPGGSHWSSMFRAAEGRERDAPAAHELAAVAVNRERHQRVGKPLAVPVKVQNGVHEGVAHPAVERLVGVGYVEAVVQQA